MKTLGLDLGTNSIGWALIETNGSDVRLLHKGVHIFEKGVGENQKGEFSRASERTKHRAARRIKMRRKWRKQVTLRVLIENGYCPGVTGADIKRWRDENIFPESREFRDWLQTKEFTKDGEPAGPYYYRWLAATERMDLSNPNIRYQLGRAFYHLAQRRGYKSNRVSGEERDGTVNAAIEELDEKRGNRTLGQYYYEECLGKIPVRGGAHYTSRKQYEEEFDTICRRQALPDSFRDALYKAIFTQRPLRSQKGTVGTCPFEPTKNRVPISHPAYERYRALQMISNIRLAAPEESELRPLTDEQRQTALDWMLILTKHKNFKDLAKKIVPKKAALEFGGLREERAPDSWVFNFREDADVSPCPVTARLVKFFGSDWREEIARRYTKAENKTFAQIEDDVWHVLFSYKDREKLVEFGHDRLGLSEKEAQEFSDSVPQGYANLSLNAVRKIIPCMEKGMIYSHAVFMANLPTVLKKRELDWSAEEAVLANEIKSILETHAMDTNCAKAVNAVLEDLKAAGRNPTNMKATPATWSRLRSDVEEAMMFQTGRWHWERMPLEERNRRIEQSLEDICRLYRTDGYAEIPTLEQRIKSLLQNRYGATEKELNKLYHPSAIETYPPAQLGEDGHWKLGSPRIPSIKNPVFMRTMTRLRHLINSLLKEGLIDPDTRVRIEMARDLNTHNERTAISREQKARAKERKEYREKIEEANFPATDTNVLKYRLWIEQDGRCLYTGNKIGLTEFLGENPVYDIEHTIPRSRTLDNSRSNLTLCERRFNRDIKQNRIPSELENADEIIERARALWSPKIAELEVMVQKRQNAAKRTPDKKNKDKNIADAHFYRNQLRYWRRKLRAFEIDEIPDMFTNSQLVDTRIICKYARLYLKSLFPKVYSVKASVVHGVKEIWGLKKKDRDNHIHHCVDALTVACLRPDFYQQLASYYREVERHERQNAPMPSAPEPWDGFAKYVHDCMEKEVLCVHYAKNNLLKKTFKRLRQRGKIKRTEQGQPIMLRGNSARGSLHKDTIYGVIQEPPTGKNNESVKICVVRKQLGKEFTDYDEIVDPHVAKLVNAQRERIEKGETVWFDEEKGIPIKSVRVRVGNIPENLIRLGEHAYASKHEYKRRQCAANDGNYITGLYRGMVNGKPKADKTVIQNYEAVEASRRGTWDVLLPATDDQGLRLRHVLKSGSVVLFYEKTPKELTAATDKDLWNRLYRVTVMEGSRIKLVHHACAQAVKDLGAGSSRIEFRGEPHSNLRLSVNKINMFVCGQDFILGPLGNITWLERSDA